MIHTAKVLKHTDVDHSMTNTEMQRNESMKRKKNPIKAIRSLVGRNQSIKTESLKPSLDEKPFASLRVQIINANDLVSKDRNGFSDPLVMLLITMCLFIYLFIIGSLTLIMVY